MPTLHDSAKAPQIQTAMDGLVLGWPYVTPGSMFGSRAYRAKGVLFAMVGGKGLILTKLRAEQSRIAAEEHDAHAFVGRGKVVPGWIEFALRGDADVAPLAPMVRIAYENALTQADS